MARVIKGIPTSWNSSISNIRLPSRIWVMTFSPCSRLIAAAHTKSAEIVILDATTLVQLQTVHPVNPPQEIIIWSHIKFSPGSHLLTACSRRQNYIVSWDLQTGGQLSTISTHGHFGCNSVSYSGCESMFGGSFGKAIITYNVLSGMSISSHSIEKSMVGTIWTHGEYLQFATIEPGSITLWQVSFTSSHAPTKIGSLSTPDNFSSEGLVLLPTLSRLAFVVDGEIHVWDAQQNKVLLHSVDVKDPRAVSLSFSSDGQFLACGTRGRECHIWKESPTGYSSYQKLLCDANVTTPLVSPNGESVISSGNNILQLQHTASSPTSFPNTSVEAFQDNPWFFIEFSPDESLVAFTQILSSIVTVLDTSSGSQWLVIDTGTMVCGIKMTEDKVIVVGDGKVVTWDLPARDCVSNIRRDINDSVQTTACRHSAPITQLHASISPDLKYVAFVNKRSSSEDLCIYNIHTGEKLAVAKSAGNKPGFTPSGHGVWTARGAGVVDQWEIVEQNGLNGIKLRKLEKGVESQSSFPWLSPHGYQVLDDGWILCSNERRLVLLPHHWQQDFRIERKWSGKFLAVWNRNLSEPLILKLEM